ncbi:unnamed protein product, partial [Polarella glacialis]
DLQGEDLYEQFRRERCAEVAMSPLARDLLLSRLLCPEMLFLADVFQRRVRVQRLPDSDEPSSKGPTPEGFLEAARAINQLDLPCLLVDSFEPPCAYGQQWQLPEAFLEGRDSLAREGAASASNSLE